MNNTTSSTNVVTDIIIWRPAGRGRRIERRAHALARRLRLPFVRRIKFEYDNPQVMGRAQSYGLPWTSNSALADFSFACTCHKRPRYSRKGRKSRHGYE